MGVLRIETGLGFKPLALGLFRLRLGRREAVSHVRVVDCLLQERDVLVLDRPQRHRFPAEEHWTGHTGTNTQLAQDCCRAVCSGSTY
jgi:hypothetical protein